MQNQELQDEEKEVLLSIYDGDPAFKQLSPNAYQYKVKYIQYTVLCMYMSYVYYIIYRIVCVCFSLFNIHTYIQHTASICTVHT
jgi:hypothetical protein